MKYRNLEWTVGRYDKDLEYIKTKGKTRQV